MFEATNGVKVEGTAGHFTLHVTSEGKTYNLDMNAERALREYFESNPESRPTVDEAVRQDLGGVLLYTKKLIRDWKTIEHDPEYVMGVLAKMSSLLVSMHDAIEEDLARYEVEITYNVPGGKR